MVSIYGTLRLQGHEYQLNAGFGPSYANVTLSGGPVIVPPLTTASPALVSVPFTVVGDDSALTVSDSNFTLPTHYGLLGRGTVTFTFTNFPSTPEVWWMTHAVYTFQK